MGFFSRIFRLGAASANEALDKLESGREVELTKGDLKALKKDEAILNAAYNDAAGVTAEFNLNLLNGVPH